MTRVLVPLLGSLALCIASFSANAAPASGQIEPFQVAYNCPSACPTVTRCKTVVKRCCPKPVCRPKPVCHPKPVCRPKVCCKKVNRCKPMKTYRCGQVTKTTCYRSTGTVLIEGGCNRINAYRYLDDHR